MVAPIQSQKVILNFAPASRTTSAIFFPFVTGTDAVAAGQTSVTDSAVPTGSTIKYVEIQFSQSNLVLVAMFTHTTITCARSGQAVVAPNVVGGSPLRNTVYHQTLRNVGQQQNSNYVLKFRPPKNIQRIREGDVWTFTTISDQVSSSACQIIYKYYR